MLNQLLQKLPQNTDILEATFGLEREGLRLTQKGILAQTDHPKALGSRSFHPYIQTDFSEQQLELITPISQSTQEARRRLGAIFDVAQRSLEEDQVIWPLSMPPISKKTRFRLLNWTKPKKSATGNNSPKLMAKNFNPFQASITT